MTAADLIKTLTDLGYWEFIATTQRPRDFEIFISTQSLLAGSQLSHIAVTDGTTLITAVLRADGSAFYYFVGDSVSTTSGSDLRSVMASQGMTP